MSRNYIAAGINKLATDWKKVSYWDPVTGYRMQLFELDHDWIMFELDRRWKYSFKLYLINYS